MYFRDINIGKLPLSILSRQTSVDFKEIIYLLYHIHVKWVYVTIYTDLNRKGQQSLFGDETRDLENRPYKTHKADLGDDNYTETNDNVTLQNCTNNTIENNGGLWLKNCTNNSMNEEEVFGNCTKNCIECKDQKCKGCEIGFYGQNCHLSCLLDCGVDGCYQFTGKCQGICNVESSIHDLLQFIRYISKKYAKTDDYCDSLQI